MSFWTCLSCSAVSVRDVPAGRPHFLGRKARPHTTGFVKAYRLANRFPAQPDCLANRIQPHALAMKCDNLLAFLVEAFRRDAPIQFYFLRQLQNLL